MNAESVTVDALPAPSSSLDSSTVEMPDHSSSPLSSQILCNPDASAPSAWEISDSFYVLPQLSEDVISSSYNMCTNTIDYQSTSSESTLDVLHSDCIDSLKLEINDNRLSIDTQEALECQSLSGDLPIFIGKDQSNFEDPVGVPAIRYDDKAETVTSSSQSMRADCNGEIIISDDSLNSSMNLRVESPMQQFYAADVDWFLDHPDNISNTMDSTHLATNTNQLWSTDFQIGEGMDYWVNILRQVEPLPLFQQAPPSPASFPSFTVGEH